MIGVVLGERYKIVSEIGHGGMANVYLAVDNVLSREVAVKILHDHLARESDLCHRFQQEASIAAKLEHPNIVKIYDYGTNAEGRSYIVSEIIRGQNLHKLQMARLKHKKGPFEPAICAMICEEVLKGLNSAHELNYIHRDVKPDNVMISKQGHVKLTDFGIAKKLSSTMTIAGQFLGSPSYSSPEQVKGNELDFRSDLYSTGIILYEALTTRLPFTGNSASDVMLKIAGGEYRSLDLIAPDLPQALRTVVNRSMQVDKNLRYASTADMIAELRSYLESIGVTNSRAGLEEYSADPKSMMLQIRARERQTQNISKKILKSTEQGQTQREFPQTSIGAFPPAFRKSLRKSTKTRTVLHPKPPEVAAPYFERRTTHHLQPPPHSNSLSHSQRRTKNLTSVRRRRSSKDFHQPPLRSGQTNSIQIPIFQRTQPQSAFFLKASAVLGSVFLFVLLFKSFVASKENSARSVAENKEQLPSSEAHHTHQLSKDSQKETAPHSGEGDTAAKALQQLRERRRIQEEERQKKIQREHERALQENRKKSAQETTRIEQKLKNIQSKPVRILESTRPKLGSPARPQAVSTQQNTMNQDSPSQNEPVSISSKLILRTVPGGLPVIINGIEREPQSRSKNALSFELSPGRLRLNIRPAVVGSTKYQGLERELFLDSGETQDLGVLRLLPLRKLTLKISGQAVVVKVNGDPYSLHAGKIELELSEGPVLLEAKSSNGKSFRRQILLKGDDLTLETSLE